MNARGKGEEFHRRSATVVVVLCKRNHGGFQANVLHRRATKLVSLLLQSIEGFPSAVIQDGVVRLEASAEQALEPHEDDLPDRWANADADVEQGRRGGGHVVHFRGGRSESIALENGSMRLFVGVKRLEQAPLIPATHGP